MTKLERVWTYMKMHGGYITGVEALRYCGYYRLSDAILKLRRRGIGITTTMIQKDGESYAQYGCSIQEMVRAEAEGLI